MEIRYQQDLRDHINHQISVAVLPSGRYLNDGEAVLRCNTCGMSLINLSKWQMIVGDRAPMGVRDAIDMQDSYHGGTMFEEGWTIAMAEDDTTYKLRRVPSQRIFETDDQVAVHVWQRALRGHVNARDALDVLAKFAPAEWARVRNLNRDERDHTGLSMDRYNWRTAATRDHV